MYWDQISIKNKAQLVWYIWFVTWLGLLGGIFLNNTYNEYVVNWSALHTLLFLILFSFRVKEFPVQLRIAYVIWVYVGTYVYGCGVLMYITTVGLAANLFFNYCPLARMLYLLPWNRKESNLTGELIYRVFFSPPVKGRFVPPRRPVF